MKKRPLLALVLAALMILGSMAIAGAVGSKLVESNSLVGVPRPYTGEANAIRGVPGGGLPWVIDLGRVNVSPEGRVDAQVRGLVFDPNDQAVIDLGIGGTNTVPNFKVIVSCLSTDDTGNATTVNVSTGLFPADSAGNSRIKDRVSLPTPCIAPIVFVTSPGGSWFATTGSSASMRP